MKKTSIRTLVTFFALSLATPLSLTLHGCATPLLLAGGAAGLGYYFGSERRDADTISQDEKAEQYMIDLMKDAGIDTENVLVRVFNHKMLLVGRVPTSQDVKKLSLLAKKVPYVRKVYNRVEVGAPLPDGQKTEDGLLAAKVKAALIAEKGLNSATLRYEVFNGNVYIMGLVSEQEAQKAIAAISKVKGLKKVIDAMDRL